jgi:hypothetical protein
MSDAIAIRNLSTGTEARNPTMHVVGLDLGRQQDPSALALLRWRWALDARPKYEVPTLKRWALGTPYMTIAADVARFLAMQPFKVDPTMLVADATGVGTPVVEMIRQEFCRLGIRGGLVSVQITAGSAVTCVDEGLWNVAKKALVSVMQVLLGQGRLLIAEQPEAATLERELRTFTVKITSAANETFESWREKDHDDLVLAVALAAWGAEQLLHLHPALPPEPDPAPLRLW